jgi:hypothetical protein
MAGEYKGLAVMTVINLPYQLPSFIGREIELSAIEELIFTSRKVLRPAGERNIPFRTKLIA